MLHKDAKKGLITAIAVNAVTLITGCSFYEDTTRSYILGRYGYIVRLDVCSGTGNEMIYFLAAAVGVFLGLSFAIWGLTRSVRARDRRSALIAAAAVIMNLLPLPLGITIDHWVIHVNAAQLSKCPPEL